jgi:NAD(P)H-dependent FMN reductase
MRSKEIGQREGLLAYPRDGALRHRFESTIKKCLVASGHDPEYPITIGDAGTSTMSKISVLGLSGSLRNARFHRGSRSLTHEIRRVATETDLIAYLATQTKIRADDFLEAGLSSGAPFDEVYQALHRKRFERGLSNSEATTAAALWAAHRAGAEISHIGLAEHFPPNGPVREPKHLAAALRAADGIIVSSPVYFGDRGSLVQSLFGFIASDASLEQDMAGKIYGGPRERAVRKRR